MNGAVHVGREDKQVKQYYYVTSSQKLSHMLVVYYRAHWSILYLAGLPIWVVLKPLETVRL